MTDRNRATSIEQWTSVQAYVLAVICLLVGIAGGWFIRGSQSPVTAAGETASAPAPAMGSANADTGSDAENGRHASCTVDRTAQDRPGQRRTSGKHRQHLLRRASVPHSR